MEIIGLFMALLYFLWLSNLISSGFRLAKRIAVATEASAANTALLVEMAQARASHLGFEAVARELGQ
jgi:hypothetical protein